MDLDGIFAGLDTKLVKYKREVGSIITQRVEQRTPKKTGALSRGWGFEMKANDITIYNTKDYASFVEYGTPRMPPVGMLRATLNEIEDISAEAARKVGLK